MAGSFLRATSQPRSFNSKLDEHAELKMRVQYGYSATSRFYCADGATFYQVSAQRRTAMFKRTSTAVPEDRLPRDNEIKAWSVQLVNAEGKLDEPRSTASILESIDLKTHMLQTVVEGEPGIPPICKIINKKEAHAAKRAAKKAGKNPGAIIKTVELNWAIDGNDLGHRLNRVKEFLEKGNKVEVVLAGKKKGRKATPEEAEALIKRIKDAVDAVEGSREIKPMEGNMLATATLFYEGKVKKEAAAALVEQEVVVEEAPLQ
ncbi:Translation initiation factor 3 N-terminal protein [Rutstroemia sp. NJR-2017a BVV2]|nr:Translation initiation factor 3 N-terminal protein [Rutstroemia sp. NJR-2017a BVV2]